MNQLTFVSCHAANVDNACQDVLLHLQRHLSIPLRFVNDIGWTERYERLDAGQVDLAWICGAPYVRRMARTQPNLDLLAAPVWQDERYGAQPVYFADVIVASASRFGTFAELQGASWAYNEPGSLSGYAALLAYLANAGYPASFFGQVTPTGAHLQSLALILAGQADVTCIDSIVLEEHLRRHPELQSAVRVLAQIGPLPSMPWVVATHVPMALRQELRHLLLAHVGSSGNPLLGFAAVTNADYDPIRQILLRASQQATYIVK